jgi:hypothetical protein
MDHLLSKELSLANLRNKQREPVLEMGFSPVIFLSSLWSFHPNFIRVNESNISRHSLVVKKRNRPQGRFLCYLQIFKKNIEFS